jgi:hypothetical protein
MHQPLVPETANLMGFLQRAFVEYRTTCGVVSLSGRPSLAAFDGPYSGHAEEYRQES